MTVREIVDRILTQMGSNLVPDVRGEVSNEIPYQALNAEKARTRLDWQPLMTLDEGLKHTISWYGDFLGATR